MKQFTDESGRGWVARPAEEATPRHHGKWYLVFEPADQTGETYAVPEFRWQNRPTADRTLRTMSEFELRRRLESALIRRA